MPKGVKGDGEKWQFSKIIFENCHFSPSPLAFLVIKKIKINIINYKIIKIYNKLKYKN